MDEKKALFRNHNEYVKCKDMQHPRRAFQHVKETNLAALKRILNFDIFINFGGFGKFNEHVEDNYIQEIFIESLSLYQIYIVYAH